MFAKKVLTLMVLLVVLVCVGYVLFRALNGDSISQIFGANPLLQPEQEVVIKKILPHGDKLDFKTLDKRVPPATFVPAPYPKLAPEAELGLPLNGLFKVGAK